MGLKGSHFLWTKNLQNLGPRVRRVRGLQAFRNQELCQEKKKIDKHLPPVQNITHTCNKVLLSISFYPFSYGMTKPFI